MDKSDNDCLKLTKLDNGVKLGIKIVPNSSKCEISGIIEGCLKIRINVPPVEGKANEKCIKFLAKQLGVPKTSITIISGETSKNKILFIKGDSEELKIKLILLFN